MPTINLMDTLAPFHKLVTIARHDALRRLPEPQLEQSAHARQIMSPRANRKRYQHEPTRQPPSATH